MAQTLIEYIKKNLKKGYTPESLKYALISQGYSRAVVERAIAKAQKEIASEIPKIKEKPIIRYEIYDENNKPIKVIDNSKKSFLKKFYGGIKYFFRD